MPKFHINNLISEKSKAYFELKESTSTPPEIREKLCYFDYYQNKAKNSESIQEIFSNDNKTNPQSKRFNLSIDYPPLSINIKGQQYKVKCTRTENVNDILNNIYCSELVGEHETFNS